MKKTNRVALYVSNTALCAFNSFKIGADGRGIEYNDIVRGFYDALYRTNVEVDLLSPSSKTPMSAYRLIIVPALYAASDAELEKLNAYAKSGGHLLYGFKSGFSDENTKVRYESQPGGISQAAGVRYQQFTIPNGVTLEGDPFGAGEENKARWWMEFLEPTTATVVARYKHHSWPAFAAMTRNSYGRGEVTYLGFMPTDVLMEKILAEEVKRAGVPERSELRFPLIVRSGTLSNGHRVRYLFNYSGTAKQFSYPFAAGTDLLSGRHVLSLAMFELQPWGVALIEEG
jgi:beta-galactosidase